MHLPMLSFPKREATIRAIPMNWVQVATALVRANGLHEGIWRASIRFGTLMGLNARMADVPVPAVLVPVLEVVLTRDDDLGPLSVDAAVVNPRSNGVQ